VVIETLDGGVIELSALSVAHPCVEFSRFAMGDLAAPAIDVSDTLRFLDDGVRGFYARVDSVRPLRAKVGNRVFAVVRR
jgi:hypothetical protein